MADNKLQCACGSSALLTPSASLMTDTGVVVGASLVSSGTKHVPVGLLNRTVQSIFLRKGGTVGVLQSVPRIEVFNVSDGNLATQSPDTGLLHILTSYLQCETGLGLLR